MTTPLIDDILRDRKPGTEDHWWPDRIGDYTRDMAEHGDPQDIADKARIMRLPAVENALTSAAARIRKLQAALEWYAEPERYKPHPHGIAFERRDISYVAVTALAALKGATEGAGE